ncbi:molybdopterin-synthase adenylyltransferase MoeB [Alteromonas sp. ASW11-19]|uniref:Molybdopterin-synthase adenylyltransferase MoeB n=1 Tax=Alteromonas salexigens TaxID=2982530 RepID=A0ABT2VUB9_9ALTE|nr:molybdopterin-synthase adenylyltransferase MoeB [Alteromonas salexigens]MCU7555821.1 molybdopterin-synthase adenylyltransferase MoeB [Alteromonas salexigens]
MPDPITHSQAMRFNRQIVLPQFDLAGQEALANARVLVFGVGGLGNAAAMSLVTSGLGAITLVDPDVVDEHNLPRQWLFSEAQVGQHKVEAAFDSLHARNRHCEIRTIAQTLGDNDIQTLLNEHDLVLDCTDNFSAREQICRLTYRAGLPLVSGAAIRFEGQLFVASPTGGSSCYGCLSQLFEAPALSCTEAGILSPVVSIIGLQQALLAIKLITNLGEVSAGSLVTFDGLSQQWHTFDVPKQGKCPVCSPSSTKS